ncbi:MAG TPA: Hpt domain-containing protein [Pseudomonadales bacterium]|nr:Hpt domain-containing protein [Pseudomonadales bacterium]
MPVLDQQPEPAIDAPEIVEEPIVLTQVANSGAAAEEANFNAPLLTEDELAELESSPAVPLILDSPVSNAQAVELVQTVEPVQTLPDVVQSVAVRPETVDAPIQTEDFDEEIAEIFIEEAEEVIEAIREFYPKWRENFADTSSLTEFRRGFHTLKGSGRMAKALEVSELAWSVENMLNRVIDGTIEPGANLCTIIDRVVEKIPSMIVAFSQRKLDPQPALSQRLSEAAFAVAGNQAMPALDLVDETAAIVTQEVSDDIPVLSMVDSVDSSEVEPADAEEIVFSADVASESADDMDEDFDATLWEIFASEAEMHLEVADQWIAHARERSPIAVETSDALQRALHTLKGSAHMAEVTPIAELAAPFEKFVKELRAYQISVGDNFTDLLVDIVAEIRYGLHLIDKHKRVVLPNMTSLLAQTANLQMSLTGSGASDSSVEVPVLATVDPTRFNNFLINDMDALMDIAPALAQWSEAGDATGLDRIVFELGEMAAGADEAGLLPISALARAIIPCYAHAKTGQSAFDQWQPLALEAHNDLIDFMDRLAASEDLFNNEALELRLAEFCSQTFSDVAVEAPLVEMTDSVQTQDSNAEDLAMLADLDPELIDIFLEEADELLEQLEGEIHSWSEDPHNSMADAVRRTLHTFKGGARMSGLMLLGTLAHDLETQIEFYTGEADAALFNMLHDAQDRMFRGVSMVRAWRSGDVAQVNFSALEATGHATHIISEPESEQIEFPTELASIALSVADSENDLLPIEDAVADAETVDFEFAEPEFAEPEVIEFAVAESEAIELDEVEPQVAELEAVEHEPVELEAVELEAVEPEPVELEAVEDEVVSFATPEAGASSGGILEYSDDIEIELLQIFLEEADELVEELEQLIADWQSAPEDNSFADGLRRNLHTLKGGARMSGLTGLGSLAHDLETQLEHFVGPADQELFTQILQYQDAILAGVGQGRALAAGQSPVPMAVALPGVTTMSDQPVFEPLPDVIEDIPLMEDVQLVEEAVGETWAEAVQEEIIAAPVLDSGETFVDEKFVAIEEPVVVINANTAVIDLGLGEDIDPELLGIFLDEAGELLEDLEAQIQSWHETPEDGSYCDALKRNLHTFKGGARMAGVMGLGDLAHDLETQLEQFSGIADEALFATIHDYQDKLVAGVALLQRVAAGQPVTDSQTGIAPVMDMQPANILPEDASIADMLSEELFQDQHIDSANMESMAALYNSDVAAPVMETAQAAPAATAKIIPFRGGQLPRGLEEAIAGKKGAQAAADAKAAQAQQEMIKVSADLLENLVNLAGETSINRSRVEQQMIDIERTSEEMEATIQRLQDQLRRLEAETDAQIQSRMSEIQERSDDFDPLEMDRYSTVQQLTSSLTESASDLLDIRSSLNNKLRDTETLLVQQARINTGLQEGLMRSRMVPFSRLEPRLRRIIRQVASELKKDIVFDLENVQGELDRTMLERMVAPLEHMLRNACDHGIETPEKRLAAGKNKQGRVVLSLGRDGGDILISLRDDGGGINVDAVRKKAIERGLLTADSSITDSEALQFILQAGFSTAEKVTQISGRGVGMDVVHSEIKSMGGSMAIHSAVGKGTEFIVRLPFTVSVNRALMVRIGEDMYAIPLTSIEGIVRVSPYELESYYDDPTARFEYAGRNYEVRYLGAMLHTKQRPNLESSVMPEPVILLRSAEHTVALHVDQLIGSREIVVKALGAQFATVPGLSGATLLGDGSVVVILDLLALVRANLVLESAAFRMDGLGEQTAVVEENITVMVCDDSVTVRKVTSRLLEREGFNVMLAKDGADALLQMQDHLPDVLLLDIEMPRMDGFEVASTMKNSQRLQDIPIIMITSRTGDKHRERAAGMGVERYMGKPYVEEELLFNINELVGERLARRMARFELSGN